MSKIPSRLRLPLICVAALLIASTLLRTILAISFPGPTSVPWTDYVRAFAVGAGGAAEWLEQLARAAKQRRVPKATLVREGLTARPRSTAGGP